MKQLSEGYPSGPEMGGGALQKEGKIDLLFAKREKWERVGVREREKCVCVRERERERERDGSLCIPVFAISIVK